MTAALLLTVGLAGCAPGTTEPSSNSEPAAGSSTAKGPASDPQSNSSAIDEVDVCAWVEQELTGLAEPLMAGDYQVGTDPATLQFNGAPDGTRSSIGCRLNANDPNTASHEDVIVSLVRADAKRYDGYSLSLPIAGGLEVRSNGDTSGSGPSSNSGVVVELDDGLFLTVDGAIPLSGPDWHFVMQRLAQVLAPGWAEGIVPRFPRDGAIDVHDMGQYCFMLDEGTVERALITLRGSEPAVGRELRRFWMDGTCMMNFDGDDRYTAITLRAAKDAAEPECLVDDLADSCVRAYIPAGESFYLVLNANGQHDHRVPLRSLAADVPRDLVLTADTSSPGWVAEESSADAPAWVKCSAATPALAAKSDNVTLIACGMTTYVTAPGIEISGTPDMNGCIVPLDSSYDVCWNPRALGAAISISESTKAGSIELFREHPREIWYTEGIFG